MEPELPMGQLGLPAEVDRGRHGTSAVQVVGRMIIFAFSLQGGTACLVKRGRQMERVSGKDRSCWSR
jgi:hypothetical protein